MSRKKILPPLTKRYTRRQALALQQDFFDAPLSVSPRKALECSSLAVANPSSTVKIT
jgi:hypothetical protein